LETQILGTGEMKYRANAAGLLPLSTDANPAATNGTQR
jgi:hypothetical protein